MVSNELLFEMTETLKNAGCSECYLFGSQYSGTATENSDIDIGVKGLEPRLFFATHSKLERIANRKVDLVDFDEKPSFFELLNEIGEIEKIG